MRKIKHYVEEMNDELESASEYAETYFDYLVLNDMPMAQKFKEMASDELKHALNIHELAVRTIETVSKICTPPEDMLRAWEESHSKYVEEYRRIKGMLG